MHFFLYSFIAVGEKKKTSQSKQAVRFVREYVIEAKATVSGVKDILEGDQKGMCAAHMIKANNGFNSYQKSA